MYTEIIFWEKIKQLTVPPLVPHLTEEEIKAFIDGKLEDHIFNFPCHSQAVERCVQTVTEAARHVCGQSARDGYIRSTLLARKILPIFETKRQFKDRV